MELAPNGDLWVLEQAGGLTGEATGRQDGDVTVGRLLDPEDQVLVGSGQNDAAHRAASP